MEETEKMVALKKAYADIILNTAKEAAGRVMLSERKAIRFEQDLRATKHEALQMLLRFKHTFDSKTTEAEIKSLNQQKKIEELEAQLGQAEETILELRTELKKAQNKLDKVKNNHMWSSNGSIEKQDKPCNEDEKHEKLANSNPILSYPTDSGFNVVSSELKNAAFNQRIIDHTCCNSAKQNVPLKSDLENSCDDKPNFASIIMRSKEPELYRNGCTQRVRAFERNLLNGNLSSSGNVVDQHILLSTLPTPKTQNIDVMKNPTRLEDKVCIKSCTYKDKPFMVRKIQRRKTRFGKAKTTSCTSNPNLVKPCRSSIVLSHCKMSSYIDNDNVKFGVGASTLPFGEAEKKNLVKNCCGLEQNVQQSKVQALSVVRRSLRKRKVKFQDGIAISYRSLHDQLTKPHPVLSCCETDLITCNVESCEEMPNSESETRIRTDVDYNTSGSADVTPRIKAVRASGFTRNATDEDMELVDVAVLVEQGDEAAESPSVSSCKLNYVKCWMDSDSKDAKTSDVISGTSSQAVNKRLVKYTFSRKRKKESLTDPDENTSLAKNNSKKMAAKKQNSAPELQKSTLMDKSSRDSRQMVQVAHQLISLSGKRWS